MEPYIDATTYQAAGERWNAGHDLYRLGPGDRDVLPWPGRYTAPLLSPPPIAVFGARWPRWVTWASRCGWPHRGPRFWARSATSSCGRGCRSWLSRSSCRIDRRAGSRWPMPTLRTLVYVLIWRGGIGRWRASSSPRRCRELAPVILLAWLVGTRRSPGRRRCRRPGGHRARRGHRRRLRLISGMAGNALRNVSTPLSVSA